MPFPSIRSQINTNGTSTSATPVVSLPTTIAAGDTIYVDFRNAAAGAIGWPADWNELYDASADGALGHQAGAWKKADGTEGGTTIQLSSANSKFRAIAVSVKDAADPTITPPQVSTVAVGTTGEPNATTCTPTGGAKDYLWITLFGMEGEQTGITAYPASYTLGQSGLANSGTAGAVTTNCTGALAARQLNAASEDAGVWDVAGTLDDSSAYTIAFHPAEPIPAPLDRTGQGRFAASIPLKKSLSLVGLTIAVNLLQTTLAATQTVNYTEHEVLIASRPSAKLSELTIAINLLQTTLKPIEENPFSQDDWSNPTLKIEKFELTWINNNLENTLSVIPIELPKNQYNWPNPAIKSGLIVDISSRVTVQPALGDPFNQKDWPNPVLRIDRPVFDHYIAKPQYYPSEPYLGESCPISLGIGTPGDLTCLTLFGLEANPFPATVSSFEIPIQPIRFGTRQGWIQARPFYYEDIVTPIGISLCVLPPIQLPLINQFNIISRPSYYIEPTGVPFKQVNWPNPSDKKSTLLTEINTVPPPVDLGTPFSQKDWKNPQPKKIGGQHWIDYFILDDNKPIIAQFITLPRYKKPFVPTWIQAGKITELNPTKIFNYPNPIIIKRPTLTHIINLLQSTLEPAPQEKPFFESKWFNPIIPARISYSGWIQNKPTYYTEESLQPSQYDWPIFRSIKKNDVGFIRFRIPESEPNFASITNIPLRIKIIAITLVQNPILITGIPPGLQPFSQNDWPIFKIVKRHIDLLTLTNSNVILYPTVGGRIICILSDATEYDLESVLELFNFDSAFTIFDLESGGSDCE